MSSDVPMNLAPLTPEQLHALADLLGQRETQLRDEVRAARRMAEERDATAVREAADRGDEATVQIQSGIDHAEFERDMRELLEIEAAHERLAGGSYGICADCGETIGYLRLQAQPAALRCARCQTLFEHGGHAGR